MKKQHIIIIAVIVVFWIGHGIIASNNRQTENTTTENQTDVRGVLLNQQSRKKQRKQLRKNQRK